MKIRHHGSVYGGWEIPAQALGKDSLCYCVGAGEDISFDVALARNYGSRVRIFDPTPAAVQHFSELTNNTAHMLPTAINHTSEQYEIDASVLNLLDFYAIGIWKKTGKQRFYAPRKTHYISHSIGNFANTSSFFEAECLTIKDALEKCGDKHIDLLKLDVEGAECEVINSMLKDKIYPHILCVEFDCRKKSSLWLYLRFHWTLLNLRQAGYIITVKNESDILFIRNSKENVLPHQ